MDGQDPPGELARTIRTGGTTGAGVVIESFPDADDELPVTPPVMTAASLEERLSGPGGDPSGDIPPGRYVLEGLLGAGSGGQVWGAHDRTLDRHIAIKALPHGAGTSRVASFIAEARITASLQHPNVLPIYDCDLAASGEPCFTMKRVDGMSLGEAIDAAKAGEHPAAISDVNGLLNVIMSVCQALSYAHHRGIIHQDIKPDNIMLGTFGEVLLVDWGCAVRGEARGESLYGTPMYMSPEQARRSHADTRSDIYGLGATFFHALLLREPTLASTADTFWAKKRAGTIDMPTVHERAWVPPLVLDIVLKALAPDPAQRYQKAEDLLSDLRRYQAGLSISAHRESWWETGLRWHRRNWRTLWAGTASILVILLLALALYGERLQSVATWGSPVVVEGLADDSWSSRWAVTAGSWELREGRLVTTAPEESFLYLRQQLHGDVAIEFTGEITPGSTPCDLSVAWSERDPFQGGSEHTTVHFQAGTFDNSYSAIYREPGSERVATAPVRLVPGKRHRIRVELDGTTQRLIIDGSTACSYEVDFAPRSGWIGVHGYYPGKAFSDIRVYSKGLPARMPATAVGDTLLHLGHVDEAAAQYDKVAHAHRGTEQAAEATYKQGLCLRRLGRMEQAEALWATLESRRFRGSAELHRLDDLVNKGEHARARAGMEALFRDRADLRKRLAQRWASWVAKPGSMPDSDLDAYLALQATLFPDAVDASASAAHALNHLGRYQETLERHPDAPNEAAAALLALGRYDEAVERCADLRWYRAAALLQLGRFDQLVAEHPENRGVCSQALVWMGRPERLGIMWRGDAWCDALQLLLTGQIDAALALPAKDERCWVIAQQHLGRHDEVLARYRPDTSRLWLYHPSLLAAERYEDAFVLARNERRLTQITRLHRLISRTAAGDEAFAAAERIELARSTPDYSANGLWFGRHLMLPYLQRLAGDAAPWERLLADRESHRQHFAGRLAHAIELLAGRSTAEDFLAQPCRAEAPAYLLLFQAMRQEERDPASALASYRTYLGLPPHQRCSDEVVPDPLADAFAAWRSDVLSAK